MNPGDWQNAPRRAGSNNPFYGWSRREASFAPPARSLTANQFHSMPHIVAKSMPKIVSLLSCFCLSS